MKVYILINSISQSVEIISDILGLSPSEYTHKGEVGKYNKNPKLFHSWVFQISGTYESVNDYIQILSQLFKKKTDQFLKLRTLESDIVISLKLVIELNSEIMPDLYFDKEFIEILSSIGASLDIDLYNLIT